MAAFSTILGALTIAGGLAYGAYAMGGGGEKPKEPPKPELPPMASAPTPETADTAAKDAEVKRRRMRALSGGKTILTSEGAASSGGAGKTLLGS